MTRSGPSASAVVVRVVPTATGPRYDASLIRTDTGTRQHSLTICTKQGTLIKSGSSRDTCKPRVLCSATTQGNSCVEPGSTILVAGATGGVGQLVCAKLLERGYKVKALSRSKEKTQSLLGDVPNLEVVYGDMRSKQSLVDAIKDVDVICCCTGTTAFPSKRWDGGNNPEQTDYIGVKNLIESTPSSIKRFILTTSAGVERSNQFPFIILNAFGVLKYKRMAEQVLEASGLPYTIIRPNRLTDGPYTSYDLNTLLKGVSGERQDVFLSLRDDQVGETSRIAVAESIVQCLQAPETTNAIFSIGSRPGSGPGQDSTKWRDMFKKTLSAS